MVVGLLRGREEIVQLCGVGGVCLGGGEGEWLLDDEDGVMMDGLGEVDGGLQDELVLAIEENWQNCLVSCLDHLIDLLLNHQGELSYHVEKYQVLPNHYL